MKNQSVTDERWDNLIILDACRYDYFRKNYDEFLDGELEIRNSQCGATPEWLQKKFTEKYDDIAYHSGNPFINSFGLNINALSLASDKLDWNPTDHFGYISDLWDKSWVQEKKTAMPGKLVDEFLDGVKLERNIIHFTQPHLPFICDESNIDYEWKQLQKLRGSDEDIPYWKKVRDYFLHDVLESFGLDIETVWFLRKKFTPATQDYERIYREDKLHKVPIFYEKSLRIALKEVSRLVDNLDGRTVVTADHGECHGEYGMYGHEDFNHNPILTNVPWLVIE